MIKIAKLRKQIEQTHKLLLKQKQQYNPIPKEHLMKLKKISTALEQHITQIMDNSTLMPLFQAAKFVLILKRYDQFQKDLLKSLEIYVQQEQKQVEQQLKDRMKTLQNTFNLKLQYCTKNKLAIKELESFVTGTYIPELTLIGIHTDPEKNPEIAEKVKLQIEDINITMNGLIQTLGTNKKHNVN